MAVSPARMCNYDESAAVSRRVIVLFWNSTPSCACLSNCSQDSLAFYGLRDSRNAKIQSALVVRCALCYILIRKFSQRPTEKSILCRTWARRLNICLPQQFAPSQVYADDTARVFNVIVQSTGFQPFQLGDRSYFITSFANRWTLPSKIKFSRNIITTNACNSQSNIENYSTIWNLTYIMQLKYNIVIDLAYR